MFGFFLALSLLDIVVSTVRGKVPHHQPQLRSDIIAVVVGVILYLIFLFGFHPYVLNTPIV
jgi:glucose uptake protein GlcU